MKIYIYGIIKKTKFLELNITGLENSPVYILSNGKLAALVSQLKKEELLTEKENVLAHHQTLEKAMDKFSTVLPVRFGVIAPSEKMVKNAILKNNEKELLSILREMEGKVEMNIRAFWPDLATPLKKIIQRAPEIASIQEQMQHSRLSLMQTVSIGESIEREILEEKEVVKNDLLSQLTPLISSYVENPLQEEKMILNMAFLIKKQSQKKILDALKTLDKKYRREKIDFIYSEPIPPYDFVNISLSAR